VAGEPLEMSFNPGRREFKFAFRHEPGIDAPTELYVPNYQYPHGYEVVVSDGEYTVDPENQCLQYHHSGAMEVHRLRLRPSKRRA
jgi:hypothetical protein